MPRRPLRPERSLSRIGRPGRQRKKRYLLCCEGRVTETEYFNHIRRIARSGLIEVKVAPRVGCHPMQLVDMAIKLEKDARSVASRHDDDNLAYDQVWCVFDVDEHGNLPETRQMAQKNQIQVACSNPCFELWALLHFQDQKSYIERTVAKQRLRQHQPAYEKKLNCTVLHERCDAAVRRATWLEQQATRNGDPFGNPTSGVWKLVTELYAQGGITVDG